ncbi:QueT transporter family protein [Enterococcus viikkiensis]|uniref:QueT transporter family protein n=1 Tax=Enterococcus viikkiensis TaxID=930854 RepID=A0ABU3FSY7_9ENTE|nr:QueT transporter family protein [Enterococcus viikkiensis]MDT2828807.1 QueT transporter family protein [Enterococcus viikkiensis]
MNLVEKKRVNVVVTNGIIMALYLALTILVSPVASGAIQFRISESLNHLVVFNRKFLWGIFGGVVVYNAIFGMGWLDVVFGGGQTLLALSLTALLQNVIKNTKIRLALNVLFFSGSMFMIAWMLNLTAQLPFWPTYGWTALSEAIIMTISAPIMFYLDKRLHFNTQV